MKNRLFASALSLALCTALFLPAAAFSDVTSAGDAWCYTQVEKAHNLGLINGYDNGAFGKNDPITRGQLVQILYNHYGTDLGTHSGFNDVYRMDYYAKAVTWASRSGIVSGYSDGTFAPNNKLTREQLVTILHRVAGSPQSDTSKLASFADSKDVAAYAAPGFAWAISSGVVSGTSATTLSPKSTASRAQVAVILIRYIEKTEGELPDPPVNPEPDTPSNEPKNADGTTNADYVNSVSAVNKNAAYPTKGAASSVNENGFFTEADVDIDGATLQYDALDALNAFLDKNGLEHAQWTVNDEVEEYTLMRAKEAYVNFAHERPDGSSIIAAGNLYKGYGSANGVVGAWADSQGHNRLMRASAGARICVARYKTVWCMTAWEDNVVKILLTKTDSGYYYNP